MALYKVVISCPNKECRQKLAVPKMSMQLHVTCPKCNTSFSYGGSKREAQFSRIFENTMSIMGWGLAFAIVIGLLFGLINQVFWLIIFFPVMMGYGIVIGAQKGIRVARLPFVSIVLISVVLSVLAYTSMLFVDYQFLNYETKEAFDNMARRESPEFVETLKETELYENMRREVLDDFLIFETGRTGFVGYLLWRLKAGDEIGLLGLHMSDLGFVGTIILWLIEMTVIGYVVGKELRKKLS